MIRLNGVDKNSTLHELSEQNGTYYLADNPNLYEVQRSNNFEFVVTGIENLVRVGINAGTIKNAQEVLRLSVSSAEVPHFTQNAIPVKRGNSTMKFAGVPEFKAGSITVTDYMGADTKGIVMAWQNCVYDVRTEKVGLASDYKKDAYLIEYTPDHQKVRQWVLRGCWVSGISEEAFSSESNNARKITVNIEYDKGYLDTSD
jgi:hypothetical protein